MSKLQERVERMEKAVSPSEIMVMFIKFVGADHGRPIELPILGWRYGLGDDQVDVLRMEGESDQQLEERAETLARQNISTGHSGVRLLHIYE